MRIASHVAAPLARAPGERAASSVQPSGRAGAGVPAAARAAPHDVVELSPAATACADCEKGEADEADEAEDGPKLTEEESAEVEELEQRDAEVRRHEMAHAAAGGQYAGSPIYEFQTGPDGRRYAVGGHVNIDIGEVRGEPEKTIEKMRVVRAAALAPAEPSGQDRRVAAEAAKKEAAAHAELAEQRTDEAASSEAPADEGDEGDEHGRRDAAPRGEARSDPAFAGDLAGERARPIITSRARGRLAWAAARRRQVGDGGAGLDLAA